LVLDLRDDVFENIMVHFVSVNTFIEEAVSSGGSVLVHGNAGISRRLGHQNMDIPFV